MKHSRALEIVPLLAASWGDDGDCMGRSLKGAGIIAEKGEKCISPGHKVSLLN